MPAPSLETMCWRPRQSLAKISFHSRCVAHLVRSSRTYARIRSLTTGTFNLIVKDRTAFRLSGAPSVQPDHLVWRGHSCPRRFCLPTKPRTHTDSIQPSSKPYKHTVRRKSRQPTHPTEFPRVFHIGKTVRVAPHLRSGRIEHSSTGKLANPKTDRSVGFFDPAVQNPRKRGFKLNQGPPSWLHHHQCLWNDGFSQTCRFLEHATVWSSTGYATTPAPFRRTAFLDAHGRKTEN